MAAASMAVVACSFVLRQWKQADCIGRPMRLSAYDTPKPSPTRRNLQRKTGQDRIDRVKYPLAAVDEDNENNDKLMPPTPTKVTRRRKRIEKKKTISSVTHALKTIQSVGETYLYTGRGRKDLEQAMDYLVSFAAEPQSPKENNLNLLFTMHPTSAALLCDHVDVLHSTAHARGDTVLGRYASIVLSIMHQLDTANTNAVYSR
ncbi:hypothetical protein THRCLA_21797 [Thraustotheca clavata]|uniref:Uncharacterized protein n=1 Tax=Thraustotheca clavata TaxID=74557 RepID=A0A1V9ZNZ6_9STRA|nr:hypothetical protein THRCLA_21797 [Thraustotheca clavata]